jgi:hypothetical protein
MKKEKIIYLSVIFGIVFISLLVAAAFYINSIIINDAQDNLNQRKEYCNKNQTLEYNMPMSDRQVKVTSSTETCLDKEQDLAKDTNTLAIRYYDKENEFVGANILRITNQYNNTPENWDILLQNLEQNGEVSPINISQVPYLDSANFETQAYQTKQNVNSKETNYYYFSDSKNIYWLTDDIAKNYFDNPREELEIIIK